MDFQNLAAGRYSVRAYRPDPIDEQTLAKVLEPARLAPTAANRQPFRLVVIDTRANEAGLRRIYRADWFVAAPLVICVCAVPSEAWVRQDGANYATVDATIVMDHLILAASDLGLGTCWVGAFDAKAAREVLSLDDGEEPIAFTPIGYPTDQPREKKRKEMSEIVRRM